MQISNFADSLSVQKSEIALTPFEATLVLTLSQPIKQLYQKLEKRSAVAVEHIVISNDTCQVTQHLVV
jgi:hypothetical protein